MKSFLISLGALFTYLVIALLFPWLWFQGMRLKKVVLRLPTPDDEPFGLVPGEGKEIKVFGLGESPMAGVGIPAYSKTLTGLTAARMKELLWRPVRWKVLADNGLTLKSMNARIEEQPKPEADAVFVAIGGNDVFELTPPWIWTKELRRCVKLLNPEGGIPLVLFSPVPPVGRFTAISNPLRLAFGCWEFLLQLSLAQVINSTDDAHLLKEGFPDGNTFFLEDGVHPSPLAYRLWAEALARKTVKFFSIN